MVHLVLAAVSAFAQAFAGQWHCSGATVATAGHPSVSFASDWHIAPVPGDAWTIVRWGNPGPAGGVAYVGYIEARKQWIYEDFHGDGSFAQVHSDGPGAGNAWAWIGTYEHGVSTDRAGPITWRSVSESRFERTFAQMIGGKQVVTATDVCTK